MNHRNRVAAAAALAITWALSSAAQAASVYLQPAVAVVTPSYTGPVALELWMNFAPAESTLGGGIDVKLAAPLDSIGFAPSSYFTTVADPSFSNFGTQYADHDFEIHFGSFEGLSGTHLLGIVTVNLARPLSGLPGSTTSVDLSINSRFGNFYAATSPFAMQTVQLGGAVIPVPEPQAAWLLLAGLAAFVLVRRPVKE